MGMLWSWCGGVGGQVDRVRWSQRQKREERSYHDRWSDSCRDIQGSFTPSNPQQVLIISNQDGWHRHYHHSYSQTCQHYPHNLRETSCPSKLGQKSIQAQSENHKFWTCTHHPEPNHIKGFSCIIAPKTQPCQWRHSPEDGQVKPYRRNGGRWWQKGRLLCLTKREADTIPIPCTTHDWSSEVLGRVFSNLCGLMETSSIKGYQYFITFTDDHSHYMHIGLCKSKDDTLGVFMAWKASTEKETGKSLKILCTDGRGKYTSSTFNIFVPNLAIGEIVLVMKPDLTSFFRKVDHAPTHSLNFKVPFFWKWL